MAQAAPKGRAEAKPTEALHRYNNKLASAIPEIVGSSFEQGLPEKRIEQKIFKKY